jgi:hypothetical protein
MRTEVICINRNEIYSHHRKLTIGKKYLLRDNHSDGCSIYNIDGTSMGLYSKDLFMNLSEYRDKQINKIIKKD